MQPIWRREIASGVFLFPAGEGAILQNVNHLNILSSQSWVNLAVIGGCNLEESDDQNEQASRDVGAGIRSSFADARPDGIQAVQTLQVGARH